MKILWDYWDILWRCAHFFRDIERSDFRVVLLVGAVLAVGSWLVASYSSRLWNKDYRAKLAHQMLCAVAALTTFACAVTYAALEYTEPVARAMIESWRARVEEDASWSARTFEQVYREIKQSGYEDPNSFEPIENKLVPLSHQESQQTAASIYANAAVSHFDRSHAFLGWILGAKADIPKEIIREDVKHFFENNGNEKYQFSRAIRLAAEHITQQLQNQTPRVVRGSRVSLLLILLFFQTLCFAAIGNAACKDLKFTIAETKR